jgi:hypothetical protein
MEIKEIKKIIKEELPKIMQTDEEVTQFILRLSSQYYAGKVETEDRFDRMLKELQKDREEQNRKWEENQKEQNQKWWENQKTLKEHGDLIEEHRREWEEKWEENQKEQNRKWWENQKTLEEHGDLIKEQNRKWEEHRREWEEKWKENQKVIQGLFEELKVMNRKHDQSIGALGTRWGLHTEASFCNGLAGILKDTFNVQVLHVTEFDDKGEVFDRPEQVELDLIVKNGILIICEIKSSISKPDMYIFEKKATFYEKLHGCKANRKIVISPMVNDKAKDLAAKLGIEVYSYGEDVENL